MSEELTSWKEIAAYLNVDRAELGEGTRAPGAQAAGEKSQRTPRRHLRIH